MIPNDMQLRGQADMIAASVQADMIAASVQDSGEDETEQDLCDDIERATYSPEDNKIRLYPARRLDPEAYARIKAAGFSWAPKQGVFVAPMWTPARADIAQALAGDIEDEDSTLTDRADARADRFEDYSDKRAGEAEQARAAVSAIAEHIPFGQPILVGHHSEKRARKDAQRITDGMSRAVKLWDTSEYWIRRAASAIRHAKYKQLPGVRARRIKTIEADQRKAQRTLDQSEKFRIAWHKVESLSQALQVATYDRVSRCFSLADYPRTPPASQYEGVMGLYSALDGGIITGEQARDIAIVSHARTTSHARRWIYHHANRIAYERAMLAESGGLQTDQVKPEKGGAIQCLWAPRGGWAWIVKVNKITVSILHNYGNGGRNFKHNVPLDKIREVMSAADVEAARAAGRLVETGDQVGFFLAEPATPDEDTAESVQNIGAIIPDPTPASRADSFAAMRESLRAGVQVVSAPQLFPTPAALAARMVDLADIPPGARVLEPSAGTGRILDAIGARPGLLVAVEINSALIDQLSRPGLTIYPGDFLAIDAAMLGRFERVIMNPPFVNGADIMHIQHAAGLLKPGGRLVALCANGPRQRERLQPLASYWEDLPIGSFAESGTGVNVALLVIDAPAATSPL
jgi:phospholipid N-methyltransferase